MQFNYVMTIDAADVSAQCGCNYTATKRISKTASITRISKTQRATRFNVWSNIKSLLIVIIIIMAQLSAISQADARAVPNRPRQLMKRHSNTYWENPCGGVYEGHNSGERGEKMKARSLQSLRRTAGDTFKELSVSSGPSINTSDIQVWFSHNPTYKFLPKLRRNSSIALKRWYRHMQTFVASFSYLHSVQHKLDDTRNNHEESNISKELNSLLSHAKTILCLIESAINMTTPLSREKKLTSFSLDAMNKRLKFRTKKHLETTHEIDFMDLKFLKFYFMDFLRKMGMILRHKKHPAAENNINNNSINSINSNSINLSLSDTSSISSNSKSVNSKELNSTKKRLGAKKRPSKKPQTQKKPRQRPYKKQPNPSEQSVA